MYVYTLYVYLHCLYINIYKYILYIHINIYMNCMYIWTPCIYFLYIIYISGRLIEPPFVVRERELGLFRLRAALDLAGLQEKKVVIVRMLAAHDIAGLKDHNKNTQQPRHFRWQNLATRSEIRERERERENHAPAQRFSVSKSSRHSAVNESWERDFFCFFLVFFVFEFPKHATPSTNSAARDYFWESFFFF